MRQDVPPCPSWPRALRELSCSEFAGPPATPCPSQEPACIANCRAPLAAASLLEGHGVREGQGRTVGLSLCPACCHGPGQACLPGLPGEGPGPLCHLGLACLQAQPARQTPQTPPQGFCVCTPGLRQPLPEGGEGGGPPGGHQGRGKERPGGSVTAEERAKEWRQRAGQAWGRATPERRAGGRQAVPGRQGCGLRSRLPSAALSGALPVDSPQPPSGDTALRAGSSTRAGAPVCPWDRPPGPGRHAGGREGTSLSVCGAHALLLHRRLWPTPAQDSTRPRTAQGQLDPLGAPRARRSSRIWNSPGAGVAEGPFFQAVTPDTQQS